MKKKEKRETEEGGKREEKKLQPSLVVVTKKARESPALSGGRVRANGRNAKLVVVGCAPGTKSFTILTETEHC